MSEDVGISLLSSVRGAKFSSLETNKSMDSALLGDAASTS